MVRVRAGGGHRKMKKNWRGAGGEGAAPPPQCTRCKECIAGVDLEVVVVVVVESWSGVGGEGAGPSPQCIRCKEFQMSTWKSFVVVVVAVGGCGGGGGAYWGLR